MRTRTFSRLFTLLALVLVGMAPALRAQELYCDVTVDTRAVSGTQYEFLSELQRQVFDYLNNRSWTQDRFEENERIGCSVQITFRSAEGLSRFTAQIAVGSRRPIYGTDRTTNVFQISDTDWTFDYNQGQPIIFDANRYDPLASILDFYAYLILGYDYDSFSELGGTPYFERARRISELAQAQGALGWQSLGDDQTRTALARQLLDPRYAPLRRAYFQFHYGVLDHFATQPQQAWETAATAIDALHDLYTQFNARRYATDVFFAAKASEIVSLFQEAPQRADMYDLLVEMDARNQQTYDRMVSR